MKYACLDNSEDKLAVAVLNSGSVAGHIPKNLAPIFSLFLHRSCNKVVVKITGKRVNHRASYGLEAPAVHCLFGSDAFLWLNSVRPRRATGLDSSDRWLQRN